MWRQSRSAWIAAADAGNRGVTCDAGPGDMESLSPLWYEFAGQAYGNVMDFDSEPWDATCEAEGSGTKDSGHDEATWDLEKGEYALKFYPREDGTAITGVYLSADPNLTAEDLNDRHLTAKDLNDDDDDDDQYVEQT